MAPNRGKHKNCFTELGRTPGAACEELVLPPQFDRAIALHRTIIFAEIAPNLGRYYDRGKERLSAVMREIIQAGRAISAVDYAGALRERDHLYRELDALIASYDAILTSSSTDPAPLGVHTKGDHILCTVWTFFGVPDINLPLLTVDGMPLGVQLARLRFEEEGLFRAAASLC